jgi:RNA polymerase sigma-70 factor (ECF subfamily)
MDSQALKDRLSQISTLWTVLFQAHQATGDAAVTAKQALVQRYCSAVYRYLLGAVGTEEVAADLAQEFALRFLRGDFQRADPQRGRFRNYLKTALVHLVNDHYRAQQQQPRPFAPDGPEAAVSPQRDPDSDLDFLASWREELLERTWAALAQVNAPYHAVLLFRVSNPEMASSQMAEQLSAQLGKPVTAAWVRKTQQRAHDKYAELLIEEVAVSLEQDTESLEQELADLDLLRYCKAALRRRQDRNPCSAEEE